MLRWKTHNSYGRVVIDVWQLWRIVKGVNDKHIANIVQYNTNGIFYCVIIEYNKYGFKIPVRSVKGLPCFDSVDDAKAYILKMVT